MESSSIPGSIGFCFVFVCLLLFFTGLFLFLFNPFSVKKIHVLISGLEPIRTRFKIIDLAVSQIISPKLHLMAYMLCVCNS